jgi:hypothetical protein
LREFEEIELSRQSCRVDCEYQGGNSLRLLSGFWPLDYNSKLLLAFRIDFYDAWSSKYENDLIIAGTISHLLFHHYFFGEKTVVENEEILAFF